MPPESIAHIHLDPVGGIAGDMFVAALLDAFPTLEAPLQQALACAGLPPTIAVRREPVTDQELAGSRLAIENDPSGLPPSGRLAAILERLAATDLSATVRATASAIYQHLGEAEAAVHSVAVADVHFHELADWDSYLDIVAAAWLIERLSPQGWSVAPLPLGSGRVATAHGRLPVPAPATLRLIEGLPVTDDGIPGERVTPTGAAILRHLKPTLALSTSAGLAVMTSGHGFGARRLPDLPNVLRAVVFSASGAPGADRIAVLRFEVDDQSPEDLAIGLDRLRRLPAVRDVCQWSCLGKKGRLGVAVQVLCEPAAVETVADACLGETASIGLRWHITNRRILAREPIDAPDGGGKRVRRPDGTTTIKADADSLADAGDYAARAARRRLVEGG
jgi:uncharacterized protein (TIGR00299 family) protein